MTEVVSWHIWFFKFSFIAPIFDFSIVLILRILNFPQNSNFNFSPNFDSFFHIFLEKVTTHPFFTYVPNCLPYFQVEQFTFMCRQHGGQNLQALLVVICVCMLDPRFSQGSPGRCHRKHPGSLVSMCRSNMGAAGSLPALLLDATAHRASVCFCLSGSFPNIFLASDQCDCYQRGHQSENWECGFQICCQISDSLKVPVSEKWWFLKKVPPDCFHNQEPLEEALPQFLELSAGCSPAGTILVIGTLTHHRRNHQRFLGGSEISLDSQTLKNAVPVNESGTTSNWFNIVFGLICWYRSSNN